MNGLTRFFLKESRDAFGPGEESLLTGERGGLVFSASVVIIGMAVLIGMIGNIGSEVVQKQRLQIAADSAAYSSAVWMARGMNTVCTLNHMMGEITAYIVILEAMGGPEAKPGEGIARRNFCNKEKIYDEVINSPWRFYSINNILFNPSVDDKLADWVEDGLVYKNTGRKCGAAIMDGELTLKSSYVTSLNKKGAINTAAIAATGVTFGFGYGAARAAAQIAHYAEDAELLLILQEMGVLKALTIQVNILVPLQKPGFRSLLPTLAAYAQNVTPKRLEKPIQETLDRLEKHYRLQKIDLAFPTPVKPDTVSGKGRQKPNAPGRFFETQAADYWKEGVDHYPIGGEQNDSHSSWKQLESFDTAAEERSQWVRATYPYVDSIRSNIRKFAGTNRNSVGWLTRSKFAAHFSVWSNRYTLNESYTLRTNRGAHMMVLPGKTEYKGNESWIKNSSDADRMFSVIVRAEAKKRSPIAASSLFSRSRNQGDVAYAQAMFYNANESNPLGKRSDRQANTGWDTLQWTPSVKAPEWWNPNASGNGNSMGPWPTLLFSTPSVNVKQLLASAIKGVTDGLIDKVGGALGELTSGLTDQLEVFTESLDGLSADIKKLTNEIDALSAEIQKENQEKNKDDPEYQAMTPEEQQKKDKTMSDEQKEKMDKKLSDLKGQVGQLSSIGDIVDTKRASVQGQLDNVNSELKGITDDLDQISQKVSDVRDQIDQIVPAMKDFVDEKVSEALDQLGDGFIGNLQNQLDSLLGNFSTGEDLLPSARSKLNWQAKLVPLTPARINQIEKEQTWIKKHTNLLTH